MGGSPSKPGGVVDHIRLNKLSETKLLELISAGHSPDERTSKGEPAICYCAQRGDLTTLILLLNHGANPALTCHRKRNALHWAIGCRHERVAIWLLENVGCLRKTIGLADRDGKDALYLAGRKALVSTAANMVIGRLSHQYPARLAAAPRFHLSPQLILALQERRRHSRSEAVSWLYKWVSKGIICRASVVRETVDINAAINGGVGPFGGGGDGPSPVTSPATHSTHARATASASAAEHVGEDASAGPRLGASRLTRVLTAQSPVLCRLGDKERKLVVARSVERRVTGMGVCLSCERAVGAGGEPDGGPRGRVVLAPRVVDQGDEYAELGIFHSSHAFFRDFYSESLPMLVTPQLLAALMFQALLCTGTVCLCQGAHIDYHALFAPSHAQGHAHTHAHGAGARLTMPAPDPSAAHMYPTAAAQSVSPAQPARQHSQSYLSTYTSQQPQPPQPHRLPPRLQTLPPRTQPQSQQALPQTQALLQLQPQSLSQPPSQSPARAQPPAPRAHASHSHGQGHGARAPAVSPASWVRTDGVPASGYDGYGYGAAIGPDMGTGLEGVGGNMNSNMNSNTAYSSAFTYDYRSAAPLPPPPGPPAVNYEFGNARFPTLESFPEAEEFSADDALSPPLYTDAIADDDDLPHRGSTREGSREDSLSRGVGSAAGASCGAGRRGSRSSGGSGASLSGVGGADGAELDYGAGYGVDVTVGASLVSYPSLSTAPSVPTCAHARADSPTRTPTRTPTHTHSPSQARVLPGHAVSPAALSALSGARMPPAEVLMGDVDVSMLPEDLDMDAQHASDDDMYAYNHENGRGTGNGLGHGTAVAAPRPSSMAALTGYGGAQEHELDMAAVRALLAAGEDKAVAPPAYSPHSQHTLEDAVEPTPETAGDTSVGMGMHGDAWPATDASTHNASSSASSSPFASATPPLCYLYPPALPAPILPLSTSRRDHAPACPATSDTSLNALRWVLSSSPAARAETLRKHLKRAPRDEDIISAFAAALQRTGKCPPVEDATTPVPLFALTSLPGSAPSAVPAPAAAPSILALKPTHLGLYEAPARPATPSHSSGSSSPPSAASAQASMGLLQTLLQRQLQLVPHLLAEDPSALAGGRRAHAHTSSSSSSSSSSSAASRRPTTHTARRTRLASALTGVPHHTAAVCACGARNCLATTVHVSYRVRLAVDGKGLVLSPSVGVFEASHHDRGLSNLPDGHIFVPFTADSRWWVSEGFNPGAIVDRDTGETHRLTTIDGRFTPGYRIAGPSAQRAPPAATMSPDFGTNAFQPSRGGQLWFTQGPFTLNVPLPHPVVGPFVYNMERLMNAAVPTRSVALDAETLFAHAMPHIASLAQARLLYVYYCRLSAALHQRYTALKLSEWAYGARRDYGLAKAYHSAAAELLLFLDRDMLALFDRPSTAVDKTLRNIAQKMRFPGIPSFPDVKYNLFADPAFAPAYRSYIAALHNTSAVDPAELTGGFPRARVLAGATGADADARVDVPSPYAPPPRPLPPPTASPVLLAELTQLQHRVQERVRVLVADVATLRDTEMALGKARCWSEAEETRDSVPMLQSQLEPITELADTVAMLSAWLTMPPAPFAGLPAVMPCCGEDLAFLYDGRAGAGVTETVLQTAALALPLAAPATVSTAVAAALPVAQPVALPTAVPVSSPMPVPLAAVVAEPEPKAVSLAIPVYVSASPVEESVAAVPLSVPTPNVPVALAGEGIQAFALPSDAAHATTAIATSASAPATAATIAASAPATSDPVPYVPRPLTLSRADAVRMGTGASAVMQGSLSLTDTPVPPSTDLAVLGVGADLTPYPSLRRTELTPTSTHTHTTLPAATSPSPSPFPVAPLSTSSSACASATPTTTPAAFAASPILAAPSRPPLPPRRRTLISLPATHAHTAAAVATTANSIVAAPASMRSHGVDATYMDAFAALPAPPSTRAVTDTLADEEGALTALLSLAPAVPTHAHSLAEQSSPPPTNTSRSRRMLVLAGDVPRVPPSRPTMTSLRRNPEAAPTTAAAAPAAESTHVFADTSVLSASMRPTAPHSDDTAPEKIVDGCPAIAADAADVAVTANVCADSVAGDATTEQPWAELCDDAVSGETGEANAVSVELEGTAYRTVFGVVKSEDIATVIAAASMCGAAGTCAEEEKRTEELEADEKEAMHSDGNAECEHEHEDEDFDPVEEDEPVDVEVGVDVTVAASIDKNVDTVASIANTNTITTAAAPALVATTSVEVELQMEVVKASSAAELPSSLSTTASVAVAADSPMSNAEHTPTSSAASDGTPAPAPFAPASALPVLAAEDVNEDVYLSLL